MRSVVAACVLAGCTASGALELDLSLPSSSALAPQGMTTITVLAQSPAMDLANTAVITNNSFSAGDFPVGSGIDIDVLLHDDFNRLVGVGEAAKPITIGAQLTTTVSMPVRRPFVYAADGTTLYSFDPTQSPLQQGTISGLQGPQLAISVGGDLLAVASQSSLQVIDTSTNMVSGTPIAIGGTIHDVAPVPGSHQVVVAHDSGVSIVDLDNQQVTVIKGPPVDRVTVGAGSGSGYIAWGLVGAVPAPVGPLDACVGSSALVSTAIGGNGGGTLQPRALSSPASAIAASTTSTDVYAALPCTNEVAEVSTGTETVMTSLPRAAAVAVSGAHVFAAGSQPSMPVCYDGSGNAVTCTAAATQTCPEQATSGDVVAYAMTGASLVVTSFPIGNGSAATTLMLPEQQETMIDPDEDAQQHAEVLHAMTLAPLDLVVLPGQQYVSLVTANTYYTLQFGVNPVVVPCLAATTNNWMLLDMAASSVAERVRTSCDLTVGPDGSAIFPNWVCAQPPAGEAPTQGSGYTPVSVGALFGAR